MSFWESLSRGARNVALAPFAGLYALGGAINTATGGQTDTYSIWSAFNNGTSGQTYSPTTQALSGYTGTAPGEPVKPNAGAWGLPVVNPAAPYVVQDVADAALAPVGLDLRKALFIAGGAYLALEALK